MNTAVNSAVAEYAEAVRAELTDLPADEVAEIVDDVRDHLDQVAAEWGGEPTLTMLAERLGTPAVYAAELRQAAGFPEPSHARRRGGLPLRVLRFLVTWGIRAALGVALVGTVISLIDGNWYVESWLAALMMIAVVLGLWTVANGPSRSPADVLRELPDVRRAERRFDVLTDTSHGAATVEFVRSLRPAWWVVRGWVVASLVMTPLGHAGAFPFVRSLEGAAVLGATVVASVWWGRRTTRTPLQGWPRLGQLTGNTLLAIAAPIIVFSIGQPAGQADVWYEPVYDGLYHQDGTPIINLFPYGPDGRLLEDVRLFDQDGRPVDNVQWIEWDADCAFAAQTSPGNAFPRALYERDWDTGRCVEVEFAAPFSSVSDDRAN